MLPFPLSRVKTEHAAVFRRIRALPHIPTSDPEFNLLIRYGLFFHLYFDIILPLL